MTTRKIEGNMVRIKNITVKKNRIYNVVPDVKPRVLLWIDDNVLHALFVIILLLLVIKASFKVVSTFVDIVESIHVPLLLGFISLVKRRHQEVDFVLHLADVSS